MRAAAPGLLLLLLLPALAGCAAPEVPVRARAGDFVVLDLSVRDASGAEVERAEGMRAVLAASLPPRLPPGWGALDVRTLPPGLAAALAGARPGDEAQTPLLPPAEAYGERSEARLLRAPRNESLPREVVLPEADVVGDRASWAGHAWRVQALGPGEGGTRVRLLEGPGEGALLELPRWWNAHYQLWRSRLRGLEGEEVRVEHLPRLGHAAGVGGVRYVVTQEGPEALADGHHPLAGQALAFRARLREVAFAGGGARPEAPDALLVDVEGRRFRLGDLRGQPALLDFFATWCVTCHQQAPILARAHEAYGDRVRIVSITVDPFDTEDRVAAFREDARRAAAAQWGRPLEASWTFAFDPTGEAARGLHVGQLPREVLLDAQGRVASASAGVRPWAELERDLAAVLQG